MEQIPATVELEPDALERFRQQGVVKASFAYFEQHDEWNLEDISIEYDDGRLLEEAFGDGIEASLRDLLEDAGASGHRLHDGYFEVDVGAGTISKRCDAFVSEIRWWQLPESVQQALIDAHVV